MRRQMVTTMYNNMNNIEIRELEINLKLTPGQRETSKDT